MRDHDPPPPEPSPWDLVGAYFEDVAAVTSTIAARNLTLWRYPQGRLDDPDRWRKDCERVAEVTTQNARDLWALWLGLPPRERVAYPLSVVELEFEQIPGSNGWQLSDQVVIPVGLAGLGPIPEHAHIEVDGADPAGAAALRACLRTRLDPLRTGYLLESVDVRNLWPGLYTGIVYITDPQRFPIAQLRIAVKGQAGEPTVPTVVLRWGIPYTPDGAPVAFDARWAPAGPIVLRAPQGGPAPPAAIAVRLDGDDGAAKELEQLLAVTAAPSGDAYVLVPTGPPPAGATGYYTGVAYTIEPEPRALAKLEIVVDQPAGA